MRIQIWAIAIALCVVLGAPQPTSAQGTFGDIGANNRSFSSNSSYRSGSNYGGTSVAGGVNARVPGGMNSPVAGGGSSVGNLGAGQFDLSQSAQATGIQLFPADRFRAGNRQIGQFVGSAMFDPRSFIGAATAGGTSGTMSLNQFSSQGRTMQRPGGAMTGRGMQQPGGNGMGGLGRGPGLGGETAKPIRAATRLAFDAPTIDSQQLKASLVRHLQQAGPIPTRLPVTVTVDGRTATLRGEVATEYDRIVAERFVSMEPGISQVANELVVAQAPKDAPQQPLTPPQAD